VVLEIVAGILREHGGNKTPLSWILAGVIGVLGLAYRFYRARRSRGEK
jgi:hypothetical protein